MLKKLLAALTRKAKKSNEITRIKTPAQFAIHAHSLTKNYTFLGGRCYRAKSACPICGGSGLYSTESLVSNLSLPCFTDCPVCNGSGMCAINSILSWRVFNKFDKDFFVDVLWQKEAFKTTLDAHKFLPIEVSK